MGELETPAVLRAAALAHRRLAEVKGRATAIPNQAILNVNRRARLTPHRRPMLALTHSR
jgi:hypothetical protein